MQAVVQEIPVVPVLEWIQEKIVETTEVIPQESAKQRTARQIVCVPVPQIQGRHRFCDSENFPEHIVATVQLLPVW